MRKVFIFTALFIFMVYWGITFLYVTPTNIISDTFFDKFRIARYFFGQNWSLFVPLPKDNKQLYYTFYRKDSNETHTYEVLESLLKLKTEQAPFNATESIREYILTNSESSVIWFAQNYVPEKSENTCNSLSQEEITLQKLQFLNTTYHFQMLKSFAVVIAKEHGLRPEDYYFSIKLVSLKIPDFENRQELLKKDNVPEIEMVFESKKFLVQP